MFHLGTPELIILLVILVLIFGVGRISKIAAELGKSVNNFRNGLKGEEEPTDAGDKKG